MLSPFEWWCRDFILPEICKPCRFLFLRNLFYMTLSIRSCEFVATEQKKDNLIVMGSQHVAICSAIGLGLPELARSAMERHIDFCCSRCLINRTFHAAGSR